MPVLGKQMELHTAPDGTKHNSAARRATKVDLT